MRLSLSLSSTAVAACLTFLDLTLPLSTLARTVVYVSEGKDNQIAIYSFDESSGALERRGEVPLEGSPGCLWPSPDGKLLYASVRSASQFATLAIDPETGGLKLLGTAPAQGSAAYVFPDHTGRWLLAAYYGDGLVSVSPIDEDGIVRQPAHDVHEVGKKAHCIQIDPSNRFAFCPHTGELNQVDQFRFSADTGKLTFNTPPVMKGGEGHGPRHLQFHPNGKWVYLVNEQGKSVTRCDFDPDSGTLTRRETLSTVPEGWDPTSGSCADIEISADGRFLYASNRGHDSIAMFAIEEESGKLTSLGQEPTEETPRSFNLVPGPDSEEHYVIAAGQRANRLVVYRRDTETGKLNALERYDSGSGPSWVLALRSADDDSP